MVSIFLLQFGDHNNGVQSLIANQSSRWPHARDRHLRDFVKLASRLVSSQAGKYSLFLKYLLPIYDK
jgi:hypothetical protein